MNGNYETNGNDKGNGNLVNATVTGRAMWYYQWQWQYKCHNGHSNGNAIMGSGLAKRIAMQNGNGNDNGDGVIIMAAVMLSTGTERIERKYQCDKSDANDVKILMAIEIQL